jgi:hypothetical protein
MVELFAEYQFKRSVAKSITLLIYVCCVFDKTFPDIVCYTNIKCIIRAFENLYIQGFHR